MKRPPTHVQVHFSSRTDLWSTPPELFHQLDAEFHFDVDVCAVAENAKCRKYFSPEDDGLKQIWRGTLWMNPPYGRTIGLWVKKTYESSIAGATVCCLVPCRSDTKWWHEYVTQADEVRLLRGRLKFGNAKAGAPFPSAIVVFRPKSASSANGRTIHGIPPVDGTRSLSR